MDDTPSNSLRILHFPTGICTDNFALPSVNFGRSHNNLDSRTVYKFYVSIASLHALREALHSVHSELNAMNAIMFCFGN